MPGTKLPGPRNRKRLVFLPALLSIGAEGESRTPTPLPELDPEPSVSTNSTTSARKSVYRIRPPLASFFLDFSHFLFLARKIKRIQTAPTGFPAENGRTDARRLRAPPRIGSREDAAVYQTSPEAGMEPPAVVTSSGDAVKTRDGPPSSAGTVFPPLAQAADFSQTGGPAKAGKTQGTHMRSTAPQPSRHAFCPAPVLRRGEDVLRLHVLSPARQIPACLPSRTAACPAAALRPRPAATTEAWR